jgi:GntR family transcriptional regulator / MocR family aminotransferase
MRAFAVDRGSPMPLIRQIYVEISGQVLSGEMRAGERLPSTRDAAAELGVSRNVVMEAYEQLASEGFLLGISGAGTYVAEGSRLEVRRPEGEGAPEDAEAATRCRDAADEAADDAGEAEGRGGGGAVDFRLGRPALELAPFRAWARLEYEERIASAPAALAGGEPEGREELRRALCEYLWRRRGVECDPERIVITSGALQGLSLLARALPLSGAEVLFEDPGHVLAREALRAAGARIMPAPVDDEGIAVDGLSSRGRPALAFVTPSHQFPLGGCLSIQRRVALVEWARKSGCLVVEDDYESEFRYDVGPVSSIQRLDPGNVAYVGTFSKILFPAIRLGYLVLPERLVARCLEAKRLTDRYCPPVPQLAMARFIREGQLDRHIARMRKAYRKRRDALVGAVEAAFPGRARILGRATGLHLAVSFEGVEFEPGLVARLASEGVIVHPVEDYVVEKGRYEDCLAMGYSHLEAAGIERGVDILRRVLGP